MKTISELNSRAWYRLLKVLYLLAYATIGIFTIYICIESYSKDYHEAILPPNLYDALNDPKFYKLDEFEKREVMEKLEIKFKVLSYDDQTNFIKDIDYKRINGFVPYSSNINNDTATINPKTGLHDEKYPSKYTYTPYNSWNIAALIIPVSISLFILFLVMEGSRRAFYYIVLGKLSPDKE